MCTLFIYVLYTYIFVTACKHVLIIVCTKLIEYT
jgi:hypothetical protein